jgi:hypothetical protein
VSGFRPIPGGGAKAKFDTEEAKILSGLATQVASLVAERGSPGEDPVLDRLLPDAYRDNNENAAEFRRFTEEDLADEKARNALAIATALEPRPDRKRITVSLDSAAAFAWVRSLTDIRLALAVRLGIETDDVEFPTEADEQLPHAIYHWLGEVQASLVYAIDR